MREGDAAHSMYFIAVGEVEIALKSKKEPLRLSVGQFFGEVEVLRRSRRSATVTALTRTNLLVLDAHDLHALMQRDRRIADLEQSIREQQARQLTLGWPLLRRCALRLGETLRTDGVIDRAEDVFYLTRAELDDLLRRYRRVWLK